MREWFRLASNRILTNFNEVKWALIWTAESGMEMNTLAASSGAAHLTGRLSLFEILGRGGVRERWFGHYKFLHQRLLLPAHERWERFFRPFFHSDKLTNCRSSISPLTPCIPSIAPLFLIFWIWQLCSGIQVWQAHNWSPPPPPSFLYLIINWTIGLWYQSLTSCRRLPPEKNFCHRVSSSSRGQHLPRPPGATSTPISSFEDPQRHGSEGDRASTSILSLQCLPLKDEKISVSPVWEAHRALFRCVHASL